MSDFNNLKLEVAEAVSYTHLLVSPLLQWFLNHARVLPWREKPTPYRVWVSEIMLQQTRVEAVKPYFEMCIRDRNTFTY